MKFLGRIAMVGCWAVLTACGAGTPETGNTEGTESQTSEIFEPTCPELVPPAPGFCEDGTIVPVYEGKCIVGFQCDRGLTATALPGETCPQLVPPGPGFCEDGTIVPVYSGKCIIAYSCT